MDLLTIRKAVEDEYKRAARKFPAFSTTHEGYAVLLEKVDELWTEVKKSPQSPERLREEAIQVAAMAFRFLSDCCD